MLIISKEAFISKLADIEDSVRGSKITICEGVRIDSFVKIKFVGGSGDVFVGRNSYINSGVVIFSGNGVAIGANVLIAPNCTLAAVNHEFQQSHMLIIDQRFQPSRGGITIEDDVWLGANSVVLDGAVLRRGCVVGANSMVNNELLPYSINFGVPARQVGIRK